MGVGPVFWGQEHSKAGKAGRPQAGSELLTHTCLGLKPEGRWEHPFPRPAQR